MCYENVANTVACNIQHQESFFSPPHVATMLRLYYGYVATRVACNIQHQEPLLPSPQHNTQHHMSATSKRNVCNIEKKVCDTQQHMSATFAKSQ
jgi:hypothetical protein